MRPRLGGVWGDWGRWGCSLTRLLWRACSTVALKRKQRQGTPASRAHLMYLGERRAGGLVKGPGPPSRDLPWDPGTWPGSGRRGLCCRSRPVSSASGLPHMRSHSAAMSPECPGDPERDQGWGLGDPGAQGPRAGGGGTPRQSDGESERTAVQGVETKRTVLVGSGGNENQVLPCSRGRIRLTRDAPGGRWTSRL